MDRKRSPQAGQSLVILLMFVTVAMMVSLAAAALTSFSITSASNTEVSTLARDLAETGMENALLRLLRDPSYTGETLTLPNGTATITVTGSSTKTISSVGRSGNFMWTVQVVAPYSNGILSIGSWTDVF